MIERLATAFAQGNAHSRDLVDGCLARIAIPDGEGARAFIHVDADRARAAAGWADQMRDHGCVPSPLAGIPIAVKDLFDVAGEVTTAGSRILADRPAARQDALAVARLRAAGAVLIGRTNMTEFAYSGVGLNPHHDTPRNPHGRDRGLIPGGSTSGGAVAVADGMAVAALGTDTGGSCRIPAALCGLVGFKPTASRVPLQGAIPLSGSFDSVGPIGHSVRCCAIVDAILAAEPVEATVEMSCAGLRLGILRDYALEDLDEDVASIFESGLARLAAAGVRFEDVAFPELHEIAEIGRNGGIVAAEAFAWHQPHLDSRGEEYDPRVRARIEMGRGQSVSEYLHALECRRWLIQRARSVTAPFDALVLPTVPILAPTVDALRADDALFAQVNRLLLRNPTIANFLDRCAVSLPCQLPGEPPVGLMLIGEHGADRHLLALASAVEAALVVHA
jgi:aspartyl-tRNA(Asn)/glutamyl-tRNA(Gln) amidotransferase subunit A